MGKASRDKGNRRERELASLLGGQRVPLSGAAGGQFTGDVMLPSGLRVEVKNRADGFKQIYAWIAGNDLLALKADRHEWLVVMRIDQLKELLDGVVPASRP